MADTLASVGVVVVGVAIFGVLEAVVGVTALEDVPVKICSVL